MADLKGAVELIAQYNNSKKKLGHLDNVHAMLRRIDGQISSKKKEITGHSSHLCQIRKNQTCLTKRIHRNENPRFFHYMVCNRQAKVQRLKEELQHNNRVEGEIGGALRSLSEQLTALQNQQQVLMTASDKKHELQAICQQLFNQVVDLQSPTQALRQLKADAQQCCSREQAEQALLQSVSQSLQMAYEGQSLFQEANNMYRQAVSLNRKAHMVNRGETQEQRLARSDDFTRNELDLQARRDPLINKANSVAVRAYKTIADALNSFPAEARVRYPQQCQSIGLGVFPKLQEAEFSSALRSDAVFGIRGSVFNDVNSGCKIQDNMNIVEQCTSITNEQLGLVVAVQAACAANIKQNEAERQRINRSINAERTRIFNYVRSALTGSSY